MPKSIHEMTDVEYFQFRLLRSMGLTEKDLLKAELSEVFGDPTNVAPGGTGAVLTTPSQLSQDLVSKIVSEMPMSILMEQIGKLAAMQIADELERQGLKPADYARVPDLPKKMAKRISGRIQGSELFLRGLVEGLTQRG